MIETRDQLIRALGNNYSRLHVDKASIANAAAGQLHSLWRATGQPGQGAIPAAAAGRSIRGVNTVLLSASTGTAGNFGVTAFYPLAEAYLPLANVRYVANWADLALEQVRNSACVSLAQLANATSTGIVRGSGKIIHG